MENDFQASKVRRRGKQPVTHKMTDKSADEDILRSSADLSEDKAVGCCNRLSRWTQNKSYEWMASTIWDNVVSGFRPGRVRAFELMDLKLDDTVLFVGEGSGLDFECLPDTVNKKAVKAFDFSPEMVRQSKIKARQHGIPEENCFVGDAQKLPFTNEKFDKIYFPLSLASIPNPAKALQEAERVLAPKGKIIILEKLIDDGVSISTARRYLNVVTSCIFADINRNLTKMLGDDSPLKIVHYETLRNKLDGMVARRLGEHYRLAVIVRHKDYVNKPDVEARITLDKNN